VQDGRPAPGWAARCCSQALTRCGGKEYDITKIEHLYQDNANRVLDESTKGKIQAVMIGLGEFSLFWQEFIKGALMDALN